MLFLWCAIEWYVRADGKNTVGPSGIFVCAAVFMCCACDRPKHKKKETNRQRRICWLRQYHIGSVENVSACFTLLTTFIKCVVRKQKCCVTICNKYECYLSTPAQDVYGANE